MITRYGLYGKWRAEVCWETGSGDVVPTRAHVQHQLIRRPNPFLYKQNGTDERWIGNCRREMLEHIVVLSERHLVRLVHCTSATITRTAANWVSTGTP